VRSAVNRGVTPRLQPPTIHPGLHAPPRGASPSRAAARRLLALIISDRKVARCVKLRTNVGRRSFLSSAYTRTRSHRSGSYAIRPTPRAPFGDPVRVAEGFSRFRREITVPRPAPRQSTAGVYKSRRRRRRPPPLLSPKASGFTWNWREIRAIELNHFDPNGTHVARNCDFLIIAAMRRSAHTRYSRARPHPPPPPPAATGV